MPHRLRTLLPAVLLLLGACGVFGDGSADTDAAADSAADSAVAQAPPPVADTVVTQQQPSDSSATGGGEPAAPPVPLTIDERLDRLVAGQEALVRRVDSLTAAVSRAAPASAGSQTPAAANQAPGAADAAQGTPATRTLSESSEVLGEAGQQVRNFGLAVVWSIVVVIVFNLSIRGLVWLLDALAERNASRRLFYKRLVPIVRIVLWIFAAYLIIRVIFQVDYQGLVAAAAAVGVAVGFAAQDLLKNLFGGIILVFDQPFQVGDKITVGGTYGEVVSIGLRSTRIVTPDDNLVSVPNAEVVDHQVANANAGELNCQVVTDMFLPGWADEALAKRIAFEAAASSKYVYLNKPIVVLVSDQFKETFLTRVRVKAYVLDPRLEFLFQSDVTERARAGFRDAGLLRPENFARQLVEGTAVGSADGDRPEPGDDG